MCRFKNVKKCRFSKQINFEKTHKTFIGYLFHFSSFKKLVKSLRNDYDNLNWNCSFCSVFNFWKCEINLTVGEWVLFKVAYLDFAWSTIVKRKKKKKKNEFKKKKKKNWSLDARQKKNFKKELTDLSKMSCHSKKNISIFFKNLFFTK